MMRHFFEVREESNMETVSKTRLRRSFGIKLLGFISMLAIAFGCTPRGPGAKRVGLKHVESREFESKHLWKHEFERDILSIYFTPGGIITAVTSDESDKHVLEKSYFCPSTGKLLWHGPMNSCLLVADTPYPVLLFKAEEGATELVCYSPDGMRELWHKRVDGKLLYVASDPAEDTVFTVTVTGPLNSPGTQQEALLTFFSIRNGERLFDISLGKLFPSYATPDDIVFCFDRVAYFAFGGTAAAVSMKTGKLVWRESLATTKVEHGMPRNMWHSVNGGTVFVSGKHVHLFSATDGILWNTHVGEGVYPRTVREVDGGMLLSYWMVQGAGVMLLDIGDGRVLWKHETSGKKKEVLSPRGIVTSGDSTLYSVDGKIISVNLKDGSERFVSDVGVEKKVYADFGFLLEQGGNAVLLGNRNVRAHDVLTGDLIWALEEFETPYATWNRYYAWVMNLQESLMMAGDVSGLSDPGPGLQIYTFYRTDLDWNMNIPVISRDSMDLRELSAKLATIMGKIVPSLDTVGIGSAAKPGTGIGGLRPGRYASFMNSLQKFVATTFEGNLTVVDLRTGQTTFHTILSGGTQCCPVAFADSSMKWAIQTYEPLGFFCKKKTVIDVFRLQLPE